MRNDSQRLEFAGQPELPRRQSHLKKMRKHDRDGGEPNKWAKRKGFAKGVFAQVEKHKQTRREDCVKSLIETPKNKALEPLREARIKIKKALDRIKKQAGLLP